jgi:hypothetical protein
VSKGNIRFCRSLKPHSSHRPFKVRKRLVVSLIMPHIGFGGIVYAGADAASQRRACLRYIYFLRRINGDKCYGHFDG